MNDETGATTAVDTPASIRANSADVSSGRNCLPPASTRGSHRDDQPQLEDEDGPEQGRAGLRRTRLRESAVAIGARVRRV